MRKKAKAASQAPHLAKAPQPNHSAASSASDWRLVALCSQYQWAVPRAKRLGLQLMFFLFADYINGALSPLLAAPPSRLSVSATFSVNDFRSFAFTKHSKSSNYTFKPCASTNRGSCRTQRIIDFTAVKTVPFHDGTESFWRYHEQRYRYWAC
jgi:hypothetical protein